VAGGGGLHRQAVLGFTRHMLGILASPENIRAEAIGRLHVREDTADLADLLIELEERVGVSVVCRAAVR
jgi:hypothetical protein